MLEGWGYTDFANPQNPSYPYSAIPWSDFPRENQNASTPLDEGLLSFYCSIDVVHEGAFSRKR